MKLSRKKSLIISSLFLLAACGGGGGGGGTTPPPPPVDTTNPVVTFTPNTLTVTSSGTGMSTLTATDNVGVTTGPTVTCTNGGSFAGTTFTAPAVAATTTSVCTATAGDAAGNTGSATLTVTINPAGPTPTTVNITGKITYDRVQHNPTTNGLNYAAISQDPARGVTVQALDASNAVLDSDVANATGDYSLTVNSNTDVRIRARAETISTTGATWDVKVTDNTNGNAIYALDGSLTSSGAADSVRNLNAGSGWGGASYTATRAAAPFAILDSIYETLQAFAAVDGTVNFPATQFRWSTRNRAESGDRTTGQINTSSYVRLSGETVGNVYILGDENNDTDEYDRHVVVHEWGHYFEDQLSRSDSIGGSHSLGNRLDLRVAMGEGWGNALSGIILGDPVYRDSGGAMQANGFSFSVDDNNGSNPGWFSEGSVQSIIYDIFDSADDGSDTISLGLGPIYRTFIANAYTGLEYYTSIFAFLNELKTQEPGSSALIDTLSGAQTIDGTGPDGAGETNNGTVATALPIYNTITVNGPAVEICSVDDNGRYNKVGNREYLRVNLASNGAYTFTMTRKSGAAATDPDFIITQGKFLFGEAEGSANNTETLNVNLNAGVYLIDAYDFNNVGQSTTQADSCFDFIVTG